MGAASGGNLQPWRLHVLSGAARDRLVDTVAETHPKVVEARSRAAKAMRAIGDQEGATEVAEETLRRCDGIECNAEVVRRCQEALGADPP